MARVCCELSMLGEPLAGHHDLQTQVSAKLCCVRSPSLQPQKLAQPTPQTQTSTLPLREWGPTSSGLGRCSDSQTLSLKSEAGLVHAGSGEVEGTWSAEPRKPLPCSTVILSSCWGCLLITHVKLGQLTTARWLHTGQDETHLWEQQVLTGPWHHPF